MNEELTNNNSPLMNTSFSISADDLDFDKCTSEIGLEPTKIWHKPLKYKKYDEIPNTNWVIECRNQRFYSINEAVEEILNIVWPVRERIK